MGVRLYVRVRGRAQLLRVYQVDTRLDLQQFNIQGEVQQALVVRPEADRERDGKVKGANLDSRSGGMNCFRGQSLRISWWRTAGSRPVPSCWRSWML